MTKRKMIEVTISSLTPMLMNRFHETAQMGGEKGSSGAFPGDRGTPREQCIPKLHTNSKDHVVLPGPNFYACVIGAGTFHKLGKTKVTTAKSSLIPAGITVVEIDSEIFDKDGNVYTVDCKGKAKWEVDSRAIVNPATGGRRMCYRPRFDTWQVSFTLDVDVSMFLPSLVRQFVDDAGIKCGIGDFRPGRKGPFGKFLVNRWDISDVLVAVA